MARVLLVKTSSLGDVVHNLPVVTDVASAMAGAEIDWVVEEPFASLPSLHSKVRSVIPVAIRRWRKNPFAAVTLSELRSFCENLRAREYDAVVDTQGLLKSAVITRMAHGMRFGLGWKASREPLFAFYDKTFDVPWNVHAVERNRTLAARALGYNPGVPVDYGIEAEPRSFAWLESSPYSVLIHATSARAKLWPERDWIALGRILTADGARCVLPWGSEDEHARSTRLAASIPEAIVPPELAVGEIASLLAGARCAVGLDTGFTHLAGALGLTTVGIYVSTDPHATGLYGCRSAANVGGRGASPSVEEVVRVLSQLPQ